MSMVRSSGTWISCRGCDRFRGCDHGAFAFEKFFLRECRKMLDTRIIANYIHRRCARRKVRASLIGRECEADFVCDACEHLRKEMHVARERQMRKLSTGTNATVLEQ